MTHRIAIRPAIVFILLMTLMIVLLIAGCVNRSVRSAEPASVLHNLYLLNELDGGLWSGSEPKGRSAYQQLASMGIRTVISVDAVAPDQALADEFGIRVVHLPIGYDTISDQRAKQLAHALATLPRPIYLHCHHGKHRGPAAICVGAIGTGELTIQEALDFMSKAGTSQNYHGLWRAIDQAQAFDDSVLFDPAIELPRQADIGDFASAMSEIDRLNELLWLCAENSFIAPDDHPDLAPASIAGQIHNLLRELEADPLTIDEGVRFEELMIESRDLASQLETQISMNEIEEAMASMNALTESCVRCHEQFRD